MNAPRTDTYTTSQSIAWWSLKRPRSAPGSQIHPRSRPSETRKRPAADTDGIGNSMWRRLVPLPAPAPAPCSPQPLIHVTSRQSGHTMRAQRAHGIGNVRSAQIPAAVATQCSSTRPVHKAILIQMARSAPPRPAEQQIGTLAADVIRRIECELNALAIPHPCHGGVVL
jgi:hypothetical protein